MFSTLWRDLLVAALLGAAGGVGFGLLQDKGLQLPGGQSDSGVRYFNLGFISAILIGALAAVITYSINTPNSKVQLVGTALIAGIGGTAILKGYVNGQAAQSEADHADQLKNIANEAADRTHDDNLKSLLTAVDETHQKARARYGMA